MYTVKELIEALSKCPADYAVLVMLHECYPFYVEMVGIDKDTETVDLITE